MAHKLRFSQTNPKALELLRQLRKETSREELDRRLLEAMKPKKEKEE